MIKKHETGNVKDDGEINGNFGQIVNEQTLCIYYRPVKHVGRRGLKLRINLKLRKFIIRTENR